MLQDSTTTFSESQRISASGDTLSTDSIDFGSRVNYDDAWNSHPGNPNPGSGEPIRVLFTVMEAFVGTGTTVTFSLEDSADNGSFLPILSTPAIAKATLVAGYQFEMIVPDKSRRYLAVNYHTDNTFETSGKIEARIALNIQTNRSW